jgi:WD40 repeat protein
LVATGSAVQVLDLDGRQLIPPIGDKDQIGTASLGAAWQPTGKHFVVAQGDGEGLRLYDSEGAFVRTLLVRKGAEIRSCLFIDDTRVAAGTSDGALVIVSLDGDILSEKRLSTISPIAGLVKVENMIVGVEGVQKQNTEPANDGATTTQTAPTEASELKLDILPNLLPPSAQCLAKAPDYSKLLAVCGPDGHVDLWSANGSTGKFERKNTIPAGSGGVNAIAFHPSGGFFATGGEDGLINLFSANGEPIETPIRGEGKRAAIHALAFVDGGKKLLSDCDRGLCIWDMEDLANAIDVSVRADLSIVERTGAFYVAENQYEQGWRIEVVSQTGEHRVVASSKTGKVRALAYAQAPNRLAYVAADRVFLLDLQSGSNIWSADVPGEGVASLAFGSEDGLLGVVVSSEENKSQKQAGSADQEWSTHLLALDARTGEKRAAIERRSAAPIVGIAGLRDASRPPFITASKNGVLESWTSDLSLAKSNDSLKVSEATNPIMALSSDETQLLVGVNSRMGVFDTALESKHAVTDLDIMISGLAVSPDGQYYAVAVKGGQVSRQDSNAIRVYDTHSQLVVERRLFDDLEAGAPIHFGESRLSALASRKLMGWPMGPKALLALSEKRLAQYASEQKREQLEKDGNQAFTDRRYGDAAALLSQAIDIDPINSDMHALLGNSLLFGAKAPADWEAADRAYSRGIEVTPYDAIAFLQRGKERFASGRFAEAEADFTSGAKYCDFFLPIVQVIAGFRGLNEGIHRLSIVLNKRGKEELYLRAAIASFAQKKWEGVIEEIGLIEKNRIELENWTNLNWPDAAKPHSDGGSSQGLGAIELDYRGRALLELGRFDEAYRDLMAAGAKLGPDDAKYGYDDLDNVSATPGGREGKRGDLFALAAKAASLSGNAGKSTDALAAARSAYAAAIAKAPNKQIWQDALAILP